MSKVTEELDFMWRERLLDEYIELWRTPIDANLIRMEGVRLVLKTQGLHVKGIEN